jgi:hypothetical protein
MLVRASPACFTSVACRERELQQNCNRASPACITSVACSVSFLGRPQNDFQCVHKLRCIGRERARAGGRDRERTAGCWRMNTKIRNEILVTLETVAATELLQSSSRAATKAATKAATELQQSSSRAATASTELILKSTNFSVHNIHAYIYTDIVSVSECVCMHVCMLYLLCMRRRYLRTNRSRHIQDNLKDCNVNRWDLQN